jgi:hypothetical protein
VTAHGAERLPSTVSKFSTAAADKEVEKDVNIAGDACLAWVARLRLEKRHRTLAALV